MSILTIAIPTYNRAKYLDLCLASLEKNEINYNDIEIIILNNNSPDNTDEIIEKYQNSLTFRYIKNKINIGPDENFKKCIKEAKSEFVWIFGDDDLFLNGFICDLTELLLKNKELGLIHLNAQIFSDDTEIINYKCQKLHVNVTESKESIFKYAHLNITFLSANIFNKTRVLEHISLDEIPNNNLGQLFLAMIAVLKSKKNCYVVSKVLAARIANSQNYNLCEVFSENYMNSLYLINDKFPITPFINIYVRRLLMIYFPANIIRVRCKLSEVTLDNCFKILFKRFKFNILFWTFTVPAMILPKKFAFLIFKFVDKLRDK